MFTDLYVTDFRGIQALKLFGFSRVNLIVGENNTGKTTLLEALTLVSAPQEAGEISQRMRLSSRLRNPNRWLRRDGSESAFSKIILKNAESELAVSLSPATYKAQTHHKGTPLEHVSNLGEYRFGCSIRHPKLKVRVVPIQHRYPNDLVGDFSTAVDLKDGEKELESLLNSVDSRIKSVRLSYEKETNLPYISADIGLSERVPIDQLGQGVNRLIAIFCELLGQRPAICFIDEIENGLHHTVLKRVWQGIAVAAERLNIQVFATTHSRECLEAAHECFSERESYDFRVVQLYRVRDQIDGRVLPQDLIEAAVNSDIEVR